MDSESNWPDGYQLVQGSTLDRAQLITVMGRAYGELGATQLGHLTKTVELYLANSSTLWWLQKAGTSRVGFTARQESAIGCLWLGQSVDQLTGALQAYVYLVYVDPAYRRRGLGRQLMTHAKKWATEQGYSQLSLQVFNKNEAAFALYSSLGYQPTAALLTLKI